MPYNRIGRNMMAINKYFKLYFKSSLAEYDLNVAEGMVLLVLYSHDGQTSDAIFKDIHDIKIGKSQDQLINELHYDKAAMTRTMQALEKKSFVLRKNNPDDSRSYLFVLTEKAKEFKPTLLSILRAWSDKILSSFDKEITALLEQSLETMMINAKDIVNSNKN